MYVCVCCVVFYPYLLNTLSLIGMCVGVNAGFLGKAREKLLVRVTSVTGKLLEKQAFLGRACIWVCSHRENFGMERGVYSSFAAALSTHAWTCIHRVSLPLMGLVPSAWGQERKGHPWTETGGLFHQGDAASTWEDVPLTHRSPPGRAGFFPDDCKAEINIPLALGNTGTPRLYFPGTLIELPFSCIWWCFSRTWGRGKSCSLGDRLVFCSVRDPPRWTRILTY